MPRLMLLRHAKSSWAEGSQADFDRPLSARGRRAAAAMAKTLAADGIIPDRILCSPARRTRETLAALIPYLGDETRILITPELYEPTSGDYRAAIASHADTATALMVIGHNPAIQATAMIFIGVGDPAISADIGGKFPTGALVIIDFPAADWASMAPHCGSIHAFIKPRDLDPGDDSGAGED